MYLCVWIFVCVCVCVCGYVSFSLSVAADAKRVVRTSVGKGRVESVWEMEEQVGGKLQ